MSTELASAGPPVHVENLRIVLSSSRADIVDEIVIDIAPGEVLGLVGESGSGKTTVGMALLGYTRRGGEVSGGDVVIEGTNLAELHDDQLRRIRGAVVSYIPQDPGTALNPALRIGTQLSEVLESRKDLSDSERDARIRH